MNRFAVLALSLVAFLVAPALAAESYKVDPVHSATVFRIKHGNVSYFWGRFNEDGGTPDGYAEKLTAATGVRYRSDGFISDMDAGFYSADYLRAWVRSAQLRRRLVEEVGEDWWRSPETGDRLRALFFEGTRPTTEEIAARLGFDPLDTGPLLHELGAA